MVLRRPDGIDANTVSAKAVLLLYDVCKCMFLCSACHLLKCSLPRRGGKGVGRWGVGRGRGRNDVVTYIVEEAAAFRVRVINQ